MVYFGNGIFRGEFLSFNTGIPDSPAPTASYWQHLVGSSVYSTHWCQILAQNRDLCLPHLHSTPPLGGCRRNIAMPFGTEKLKWCSYPAVKIFWRYVYSFWQNVRTNVTDTQIDRRTDRRTPHDDVGHACVACAAKTEDMFSHFNRLPASDTHRQTSCDSIVPRYA